MYDGRMDYQAGSVEEKRHSDVLSLGGFTSNEISGLLETRDNHKQLRFARWLYEHKYIEG
jgi:hypothetical protein